VGEGNGGAVAHEAIPSPSMKKLLILAIVVALGVVAAKRLRPS
jgi:hypothetical protein